MKDVKEVINPNRTVETTLQLHASQFTSIAMQTRLSDEQ